MITHGHVQNGVVVLPEGVQIPEGEEVIVHAPSACAPKKHSLLDIPAVSLGSLLRPLGEDDLMEEMLEGRS
jgi:hypothetical protein